MLQLQNDTLLKKLSWVLLPWNTLNRLIFSLLFHFEVTINFTFSAMADPFFDVYYFRLFASPPSRKWGHLAVSGNHAGVIVVVTQSSLSVVESRVIAWRAKEKSANAQEASSAKVTVLIMLLYSRTFHHFFSSFQLSNRKNLDYIITFLAPLPFYYISTKHSRFFALRRHCWRHSSVARCEYIRKLAHTSHSARKLDMFECINILG